MVIYFAYGSNMSEKRLDSRCVHPTKWCIAQLADYELVFNKLKKDYTGAANIEPREGASVWGIVYTVTEQELLKLDKAERVRNGDYKRQNVVVSPVNNPLDAVAYVALKKGDNLKPSKEYLSYLIKGAKEHELPIDYISFLEGISCTK